MTATQIQGHRRLFTLANAISAYRIGAGPVCAFILVYPGRSAAVAALVLMVLAEISDLLDGYVARSTGQVSASGKILDPMADALYRGAVFVAFAFNGWIPVWMLALILTRDLIVANLREYAESWVGTLAARSSGKWKAIVQGAAQLSIVALVAMGGEPDQQHRLFFLIMLPAVAVTVYSLFDYAISVLRKPPRSERA